MNEHLSFQTQEEQEQWVRLNLGSISITQLRSLLKSYINHDCEIYVPEKGETVWQYRETIELIEAEIESRSDRNR